MSLWSWFKFNHPPCEKHDEDHETTGAVRQAAQRAVSGANLLSMVAQEQRRKVQELQAERALNKLVDFMDHAPDHKK
jgi:hypothetical protein